MELQVAEGTSSSTYLRLFPPGRSEVMHKSRSPDVDGLTRCCSELKEVSNQCSLFSVQQNPTLLNQDVGVVDQERTGAAERRC